MPNSFVGYFKYLTRCYPPLLLGGRALRQSLKLGFLSIRIAMSTSLDPRSFISCLLLPAIKALFNKYTFSGKGKSFCVKIYDRLLSLATGRATTLAVTDMIRGRGSIEIP
jgi:hypothetical protein